MKRLVLLFLGVLLCLSAVGCYEPDNPTISTPSKQTNVSSVVSSEETPAQPGAKFDLDSWEMTLVNPWNSLPEDFNPELALIDSKYAGFAGAQFDARAIDQLHAMCDAAAEEGVKLTVISAYRTSDFQTYNFNRKVNRVMEANPTLSREEAEEEAAKVVARPGTSEHQLGLAVDFNSVQDSFKNTAEYAWLKANCTDYGFIIRYTADKQAVTGIIPEPWHYRYVGVEAAKAIEESGLCFEEFIEAENDKDV